MRCPDCNKFVSLEFQEPEVESLELSDGTVSCTVSLVRECAECGTDLKTAQLEMSEDLPDEVTDAHTGDDHELSVEETGVEQVEEGGGRYAKSYFGATVNYEIRCECQKEGDDPIYSGSLTDKIAASQMDENC